MATVALPRAERRFECTGCGRCCYGGPQHVVEVDAQEQEAIRRFLKLSLRWFRRRYLRIIDAHLTSLRFEEDGRCMFLTPDHRCRIYAVRPRQCRFYPFWPELVSSLRAWRAEGRRCEGLGRGAVIPLRQIAAKLKEQD